MREIRVRLTEKDNYLSGEVLPADAPDPDRVVFRGLFPLRNFGFMVTALFCDMPLQTAQHWTLRGQLSLEHMLMKVITNAVTRPGQSWYALGVPTTAATDRDQLSQAIDAAMSEAGGWMNPIIGTEQNVLFYDIAIPDNAIAKARKAIKRALRQYGIGDFYLIPRPPLD